MCTETPSARELRLVKCLRRTFKAKDDRRTLPRMDQAFGKAVKRRHTDPAADKRRPVGDVLHGKPVAQAGEYVEPGAGWSLDRAAVPPPTTR